MASLLAAARSKVRALGVASHAIRPDRAVTPLSFVVIRAPRLCKSPLFTPNLSRCMSGRHGPHHNSTPAPPPQPASANVETAATNTDADVISESESAGSPSAAADTNTDADFETEPAALTPPPLSDKTSDTVWTALAGNAGIAALKAIVWWRSGSSAMLVEALHSVIDTANQALLAMGLRQSQLRPDAAHQFGYGKAAFVWSLISACGMLWVGGGVGVAHGVHALLDPGHALELNWENWAVLAASFAIDGAVLRMTLKELASRASAQFPALYASGFTGRLRAVAQHMRASTDPFLTAVALEDFAACAGVLIAAGGIGLSQLLGVAAFDAGASIAIGTMLGAVSVALIRLNMRYLLGQSVDRAVVASLNDIMRSFPSIDGVRYVHTQWLGPTTFLLSAKLDFDGTFIAAKLHREYEDLFLRSPSLQDDLPLLLSFYSEDVTRVVEKELKDIESAIRAKHPAAILIHLEPYSKDSDTHIVKAMAETSRRDSEMSAEAEEVLMHHTLVLANLKRSRPDDPRLELQERRIQAWYQRHMQSKAAREREREAGSAAAATSPVGAPGVGAPAVATAAGRPHEL